MSVRSRLRSIAAALRIAFVVLAAAVLSAASPAGGTDSRVSLGVKGHSNANPSIAGLGKFVAVVWGAASDSDGTDVYTAVSRDGGRTFGEPKRVTNSVGNVRLSGEQPPRVTLLPQSGRDPALVVVWTEKEAAGTRLLWSRSDDSGASFTRPKSITGTEVSGNRGWEAIATERNGGVVAIWLDHREQAGMHANSTNHDGQAHSGHQSAGDSVAKAQLSKLYFARLDGSNQATTLTSGVCYCCKTAVATGQDGSIYAAWRHVYPGNVRDIALTLSRDSGRTFEAPTRVSDDRWVLDGCPENGPAVAVDHRNVVHILWPTLVSGSKAGDEPELALFYSTSQNGRQFTPRYRIPTQGTPRHPQIAVAADGAPAIAWDEQLNGTRRVIAAKAVADGGPRFIRVPLGSFERGEYPVVAAVDDGFVAAWIGGVPAQSVIRVQRFPASQVKLPPTRTTH
jgi:hypothetical protein